MKILYIHTLYSPYIIGGAEISLQLIVETMKRKGHDVVVLTTTDQEGLNKDIVNNVPVYRASIKNIYWPYNKEEKSALQKIQWHYNDRYNAKMKQYVEEVLQKEKPDIVSCHNLTGFSISVWDIVKKYNIPIVQVLHDFYMLCINSNMYKTENQCKTPCLSCKLMRAIHKRKSQNIQAVVGISQYILDKVLAQGYFDTAIKKVIYNTRIIKSIDKNTNKDTTKKLRFGFIGTLADNKGIKWLIDEFKDIDSPSTILLIAGKGEENYLKDLQQRAKQDSRISFLGYIDSQKFYSMIDFLIVPSLWDEPLGMVAIEACANGIPVITTGNGGLKEIITDNFNGLHVNYAPHSLKSTITKIINDIHLRTRLVENTYSSVSKFIDVDRITTEYEAVYNELTKKQK